MLKKSLLSGVLFIAAIATAAPFTPQFDESVKVETDLSQGAIWVKTNGQLVSGVNMSPGTGAALVKVSSAGGALTIDTTEFKKENPFGMVIVRIYGLPRSNNDLSQECTLSLKISGTPGEADLLFEGSQGAEKKHFWKAQKFAVTESPATTNFAAELPGDLKQLWLRLDLKFGGIYHIYQADFAPALK